MYDDEKISKSKAQLKSYRFGGRGGTSDASGVLLDLTPLDDHTRSGFYGHLPTVAN